MGTFDILNMRVNGYDFHIELMKGDEKWTDPKAAAVFDAWKELLPYNGDTPAPSAGPGRTPPSLLVQKKAGMYFLGTFAGQQATEQADHDDLDFFPFPTLGTEFDAELGIDAPIDGFMLTAKSPNLAPTGRRKAFLEYLGHRPGPDHLPRRQPEQRRCRQRRGHERLQRHSRRSRPRSSAASSAIAQFLDRDTDPDFARPRMQGFLQTWLTNPNQDIDRLPQRASRTSGTRSASPDAIEQPYD